jgi:hypothetical protein
VWNTIWDGREKNKGFRRCGLDKKDKRTISTAMDTWQTPPLFPGIGQNSTWDSQIEALTAGDLAKIEAALDCMAVARFQGEDLDGLSQASLRLIGWMDVGNVHLPLSGIAAYWPSPAHGRLSTDSGALKQLGKAIEPFLEGTLEAKPLPGHDVQPFLQSVERRTLCARTYTLPLDLSAHARLAARAWLEAIGAH